MSYPQPQASREVQDGQEFFRLFTQIQSSGDVYEMDASAKAFAIGPESDVSRVRVTYFDPSQQRRSSSFVVSVDNPFIGRVDAANPTNFPISNSSGKILISIEEIVNYDELKNSVLTGSAEISVAAGDGFLSIYPPKLDLQAFLSTPSFGPRRRSDRVIRGRSGFIAAGAGPRRSFVLFPTYRRRYASVTLGRFFTPAVNTRARLIGLNLLTEGYLSTGPSELMPYMATYVPNSTEVPIPHAPSSAIYEGETLEWRASASGVFDYMAVELSADLGADALPSNLQDGIYYTIRTSDEEA